ncbi:MAG: hypothetical protein AAF738_06590, partial [Bacteroidota bacterium]
SIFVAEEYFIKDSINIQPDSVIVAGPSSVVSTLKNWPTKLFRRKNLNKTLQDSVYLEQDDNGVLEFLPKKIKVEVPVERYAEKSFFVPVTYEHNFDSLTIFPNRIKLNVVVGLSDFNSISEDDFVLEADLKTATRTGDNNTAPLMLTKSPVRALSVYFSPKAVEFFIVEQEEDASSNTQ